jgi:hypothetical protein
MCFNEPELPDVPDVDKNIVRNVLYTAWALQVFSIHFVCLLISKINSFQLGKFIRTKYWLESS